MADFISPKSHKSLNVVEKRKAALNKTFAYT